MSKITILALLVTIVFFGWFVQDNESAARTSPASLTSSLMAASNPIENAPKRRSKIETEALVLETTLASLPGAAPMETALDPLPQPAQGVRYVSAGTLRMRAGPSTGAEMIASYPRGTPVTIKEQDGGWYRVTAPDGRTGWMSVKYLSQQVAGGKG